MESTFAALKDIISPNVTEEWFESRIKIKPEVFEALKSGCSVVALESTIISHGMPYPQNFETCKQVEQIVRDNGSVPATIAILEGVIHVGLDDEQLEKLATLGLKSKKCSRRDMGYILAINGNGSTTVAGTMFVANLVGISVFVTGGIGGVHRGVAETLDISADLTELGRTPVTVICAGAKSILDIPKTLEFLETCGVPVVGYGTSEFPAFFTPKSGERTSCQMDTPEDIAKLMKQNKMLGMRNGTIVSVPIPQEMAANTAHIEEATQKAIAETHEKSLKGFEITPFLLQRINELTSGDSLRANIALIKNNAVVGSKIAAAFSKTA